MTVKIVVDSLADLPAEQVERHGIEIIPLTVRFGTTEFKDGVDLTADDFYQRLAAGHDYPATAVPSIGEFVEMYERVGRDADGIISIHVSSKVSGTYNAAVQGAREAGVGAGCPIEVVDSLQASMGIGMLALVASEAAATGADLPTVVERVRGAMSRVNCTTLLDTLEYLQKGGRIGKAQALVGTLLNFKPMIEVTDGLVHPFARPRSRKKGIARLIERARELAPAERLVVLHSTTPDEASALASELGDLTDGEVMISRYGPGLGTYVGPGALGIGILRSGGD
jgi:DegV family protein with EDD domain